MPINGKPNVLSVCPGPIKRREFLRIGLSGFASLSLPGLFRLRAQAVTEKPNEPWFATWDGKKIKPRKVIRAGNDGRGAQTAIERLTTGLRWRAVSPPLIAQGELTAAHLAACGELGQTLAAGLEAGIF